MGKHRKVSFVLAIMLLFSLLFGQTAVAFEKDNSVNAPATVAKKGLFSMSKAAEGIDVESNNILPLDSILPSSSKPIVIKEKEPNNDNSGANSLGSDLIKDQPYDVIGTITGKANDVDFYSFTLPYKGQINLLALWIGDYAGYMDYEDDLFIRLYDSNGILITKSTYISLGVISFQIIDEQLDAGTYYISVNASTEYGDLYVDEEYSMALIFDPQDENTLILPTMHYETEQNNNIEQANAIDVSFKSENYGSIIGDITETHTDKDFYKVNLPVGGTLDIWAYWFGNIMGEGFEDDMLLNIRNDSGDIIATSNLLGSDWEAMQVIQEFELTKGTYYIEIYQTSNLANLYLDEEYCIDFVFLADPTAVEADSLTLDKTSMSINIGQDEQLTAAIQTQNASCKEVLWSSGDESIAIVDENGKVRGVGYGKTYITAKAMYGNGTARCLVTVEDTAVINEPIPSGTVVIGNKGFDLNYANNPANQYEIIHELVYGDGSVLVKKFNGSWIDNNTGLDVERADIPAITYKDAEGNITEYKAGDGTIH